MRRFLALFFSLLPALAAQDLPAFRATDIITGLKMGYQLVLADLNNDTRPDILVVDERAEELAWYQNPTWQRHVLLAGVPRIINLECAQLEGSPTPEIVLAHGFEMNPERSTGRLLLLKSGPDPTQPWSATEIDQVPTAHRIRWIPRPGEALPWLLVAPLVGLRSFAPDYNGPAPIYAYRPGEWKRIPITEDLHGILHSIHPIEWTPGHWQLLSASFDGIHRLSPTAGLWQRHRISAGQAEPCPRCGSSEVKDGHLANRRFLATIEPWHGEHVAVYVQQGDAWQRTVIESGMQNGHALAVADLNGDGRDEIVSGFRGKGFRVTVYQAQDAQGLTWKPTVIDEGGVAGADCKIADINADSRPDILCSGASTGNVRLFENLGKGH